MSHDAIQPTLSARHEGSLADRISGLPLVELLAFASFEASRDDPAPIAPALRLTFELASRLRRAHVLELLESPPRGLSSRQARALYDPIAWVYLAEPLEPGVLRHLLAEAIRCNASPDDTDGLWLWQRLSEAECEGYVTHLLRRHQMVPTWTRALLERTQHELEELCLAQRRAVSWAGLKEGAATFLRTKGDPEQCLDAMVIEVRRQARWLRRHRPQSTGWIPNGAWRQPLLLRQFLAAFPLGHRYWTEVPSLDALRALSR